MKGASDKHSRGHSRGHRTVGGIAKDSDYRRIEGAAWKFRLGERAESRHWQNLKWQNLIAREMKI